MSTAQSLYQKYRPKSFKGIVGQPQAVAQMEALLEKGLPHAILYSGTRGTGKTTFAFILKKKLNCSDIDFHYLNIADLRGIDNVREISDRLHVSPLGGDTKIWVLDECHQMTDQAQNALLLLIENPPTDTYFIVCTTHPEGLLATVRSRCTEIRLQRISETVLTDLVIKIADREEVAIAREVAEKIAEAADGSARDALTILESVLWLPAEDQLDAVEKGSALKAGIDLARALMNLKTTWGDITTILRNLDEEPETVRRGILGYANSCMLGGKGGVTKPATLDRAYKVIKRFSENFFYSGKAGLTAACWEVVSE